MLVYFYWFSLGDQFIWGQQQLLLLLFSDKQTKIIKRYTHKYPSSWLFIYTKNIILTNILSKISSGRLLEINIYKTLYIIYYLACALALPAISDRVHVCADISARGESIIGVWTLRIMQRIYYLHDVVPSTWPDNAVFTIVTISF